MLSHLGALARERLFPTIKLQTPKHSVKHTYNRYNINVRRVVYCFVVNHTSDKRLVSSSKAFRACVEIDTARLAAASALSTDSSILFITETGTPMVCSDCTTNVMLSVCMAEPLDDADCELAPA